MLTLIKLTVERCDFLSGEILRERRESLGFGVRQIADVLKINDDYITAIENDDFGKLPVPVYTMGYIRCYAGHLGVDAEPIIEHYRKHLSNPGPSTVMPVDFSRKRRPAAIYVLFLIVAGLLGFLAVTRFIPAGPTPVAKVQPLAPPVRTEAPPAKPEVVPPQPAPTSGPAAYPETAKPEIPASSHNLELTAREKTWIYLTFGDSGRTEEMLLQPGASRTWNFSGKALLKIGNAGGVDVLLDGRGLGALGKSGEVRTLSLGGGAAKE
jgi:cytoskeleton protein RodZ